MQSPITRLGLFQFLAIAYSILGTGVWMKVVEAAGEPRLFATLVRDYGVLLLLLPAIWLIAASVEAHRPKCDTGDVGLILSSGIGLLGLLLLVGFFATMSAMSPWTHVVVQKTPPSTPVPARFKKALE
jgi:hypothetical protein